MSILDKNQEKMLDVVRYFLKSSGSEGQISLCLKNCFAVSLRVTGIFQAKTTQSHVSNIAEGLNSSQGGFCSKVLLLTSNKLSELSKDSWSLIPRPEKHK